MVHPSDGTMLNNQKEWTSDTHITLVNLKNNLAKWKKWPKTVHPVWFHFYKFLENVSLSVVTEGR